MQHHAINVIQEQMKEKDLSFAPAIRYLGTRYELSKHTFDRYRCLGETNTCIQADLPGKHFSSQRHQGMHQVQMIVAEAQGDHIHMIVVEAQGNHKDPIKFIVRNLIVSKIHLDFS